MELIFRQPEFLWFLVLLPALVVVHFYSLKNVERKAVMFSNYKALRRITGGEPVPKNYLLLAGRLVTLAIFVLSASGATLMLDQTSAKYDMVIAIDTSPSMSATDFSPSRLNASLEQASAFVSQLPNSTHVGVVVFSSSAMMLSDPLKSGKQEALDALSHVTASTIGGTAMGDAIVASTNALIGSDRTKAIVVLTDGNTNTGISVDEAGRYAAEDGVKVYAIGVGGQGAGSQTAGGILSSLDMGTLQSLADTTGGSAVIAFNNGELGAAFSELSTQTASIKQPLELSVWLMIVAFAFVFLDWALSGTKYRIIP